MHLQKQYIPVCLKALHHILVCGVSAEFYAPELEAACACELFCLLYQVCRHGVYHDVYMVSLALHDAAAHCVVCYIHREIVRRLIFYHLVNKLILHDRYVGFSADYLV